MSDPVVFSPRVWNEVVARAAAVPEWYLSVDHRVIAAADAELKRLQAEVERYRTALAATQVALDIHWLDDVTGSSAEAYGIVRDALKSPTDEEAKP